MVHAATTHRANAKPTEKKWLPPETHQATIAKHHAGLGFNGASLKARISNIEVNQKPDILVDRLHQTHFTGLLSLADKLGMTEAVDDLLACQEKTNLRPFLNALVDRIQKTVSAETDALIKADFESLYQTLSSNGITLDKDAFMTLVKATKSENYGNMRVSICAMANTDFDTDDNKMRLSIFTDEKDLSLIQAPTCNLSRSTLKVLKEHDSKALLLTETEALCFQNYDLHGIYESLIPFKAHELAQPPKTLIKKILENDEDDFFPWLIDETMTEEEKEQEIDMLLPHLESVIASRQQEETPSNSTFLSEWFASKIHRIDDDALKLLAHSSPIHMVTENECLGDIIARELVTDDGNEDNGESLLQVTPEKAIETLVGININRQLFNLYDTLHFVGREDELNKTLKQALNGKRNARTVFKRADK